MCLLVLKLIDAYFMTTDIDMSDENRFQTDSHNLEDVWGLVHTLHMDSRTVG